MHIYTDPERATHKPFLHKSNRCIHEPLAPWEGIGDTSMCPNQETEPESTSRRGPFCSALAL